MPSARSGPPAATIRPGACPASDEAESFGTAPTASHTGDKWKRCLLATKKITANGLVRRGRPEGVPLVRFDHSLSEYKQAFMSHGHCHKPRGTRSDVVILNLSPSSGI